MVSLKVVSPVAPAYRVPFLPTHLFHRATTLPMTTDPPPAPS